MATITPTSTKNQILDAYNEVFEKLKQQEQNNTALKKEIAEKDKLQKQVKNEINSDDFFSTIDQLKSIFNNQIDELKTNLINEKEKLQRLQKSLDIEKLDLDELYQIKAEAQSLEALIATQKQEKEKFETEFVKRKSLLDEEISSKKEQWKKEEEEYLYKTKIERRNEVDTYLLKKQKQDQELKEQKENFDKNMLVREEAVHSKETEFNELKSKVDTFEDILKKEVANKEKEISEKLKKEYDYQKQLDNKDLEVKVKLFEHEIGVLKEKLTDQKEIISQLMDKSTKATDQVKDIALRAIDGASNTKFVIEKNKEEHKQ
jgi:hypothetical protein